MLSNLLLSLGVILLTMFNIYIYKKLERLEHIIHILMAANDKQVSNYFEDTLSKAADEILAKLRENHLKDKH